jgi:hypothetical protein
LDEAMTNAADNLPLIGTSLDRNLRGGAIDAQPTDTTGAAMGLGALVLLSSAVFLRKLKPE